jgi:hypothetical protein
MLRIPRTQWVQLQMKNLADRNVLLPLWLGSAATVTMARFIQAADPGYDLGLQLQAAHNLLAGRGLTTFSELGPNLSHPNVLVPLTWFPAGYSLAAAAFSSAGLGVGMTVKVLGAAATMLGWWGWARLAQSFIGEGVTRPIWKWAAIVIAVTAPLLFTQPWGGTDIFLWAVVPWVLEYTVRASEWKTREAVRFDWLAGSLCAFACLMRYASLFLVGYVMCVIVWQSRLRARELFYRSFAFGVGVLPAFMLQGYLNYLRPNESKVTPGGLFDAHVNVFSRLEAGIPSLHNANYLWAFWIPGKIAGPMFPVRGNSFPLLLALLLAAFALLLLAFETYLSAFKLTSRDTRLLALGLFPTIPLFLWGCMTLSASNYLRDLRYFWPVIPLSVLVAYSIAFIGDVPHRHVTRRFLRQVAALYMFGYVGMSLVYLFFLFMPGTIGDSQRQKVMAGSFEHWPSMAVTYEYSAGRRFVLEQLKEDPGVLLVTSTPAAFHWDPAFDASRIHATNCGGSEPRYFEGPVRILILTFDEGAPDEVWGYRGNSTFGFRSRAPCFDRLPGRRLVRRFPDEGMKLLEASVAPGQRISLN